MEPSPLTVVVLAGGQGKRLGIAGPKVLAEICGAPALDYVLDAQAALTPATTLVVVCHQKKQVIEFLARRHPQAKPVDQGTPLGTGHAVAKALEAHPDLDGDVLVLFGDGPLITAPTLKWMLDQHRANKAQCTMMTARLTDPTGYGRIVKNDAGAFAQVVEEKDADESIRAIQEVHCGLVVFQASSLRAALKQITTENAQGEYYLTDAYQLIREAGGAVKPFLMNDFEQALGYNTASELLDVRQRVRLRLLAMHQENGVEIEDPATVFVDKDVTIGAGTRILPFTVMRGPIRIGERCEVGPFTHLRAGAELRDRAEVGNFVEVKNSCLGEGSKAKHLTYLGDTTIGKKTNIGAGTVTANYDGTAKHKTTIGDRAFIGSGALLVAPVEVGDGAIVGAGAVVTKGRVEADSIVVGVPARTLRKREDSPDGASGKGNDG